MWFVFGLITLFSFCVYQTYNRINAGWKGEFAQSNGVKYYFKLDSHNGKTTSIKLGLDTTQGFDFTFKRESSLDRFFKHVGISKEHQIGNSKFDDLIYVVSDDELLHQQISTDQNLVKDVIKLFSFSDGGLDKVKELRCSSGRLWITYSTPSGFDKQDTAPLARAVLPRLVAIADCLKVADYRGSAKGKDPFLFKAAVILAISSGLFFNGALQTYRILMDEFPFVVDVDLLRMDTIFATVLIASILIFITWRILGRSARTHLVLIELIFVGCIGTGLTVNAQLRELNMEMDDSTLMEYVVTTHDKQISGSGRSNRYYLYVDDWTTKDRIARKKIRVPNSLYHSVNIDEKVLIEQRAGYLKYRWVSNVTVF